VGQLNSIPVIALLDPCDFPVPICFWRGVWIRTLTVADPRGASRDS
jgi:hypothetical protein